MIDYESLQEVIRASFKKVAEPFSAVPQGVGDVVETEEEWRNTLFILTDASLHSSLPDVLITLLTDPDKSGMDSVVRALVPSQEYDEPQRFDSYDKSEANAILLWLSYVRPLQWGVEDDDMDAAEAFWTAKVETFRNERNRRAAERERAKRNRADRR